MKKLWLVALVSLTLFSLAFSAAYFRFMPHIWSPGAQPLGMLSILALSLCTSTYCIFEVTRLLRGRPSMLPLAIASLVIVCALAAQLIGGLGYLPSLRRSADTMSKEQLKRVEADIDAYLSRMSPSPAP